ncbi:MAG: hypothetical protein ACTSO9_16620 [Candidatus Helarchaeota archaeon]
MTTFDPDKFLSNLKGKVAFFPCSGFEFKRIMKIPFNILICADIQRLNSHRTTFDLEDAQLIKATVQTTILHLKNNRWLFLFSQENHDVLERIRKSGHKISFFIAQDDSGQLECEFLFKRYPGAQGKSFIKTYHPREASNYERVDNFPNFVEILENAEFPLFYYTHRPFEYAKIFKNFLNVQEIECPFKWNRWMTLYCYKISLISEFPPVKTIKTNNVIVNIKFGNILNHLSGLDCAILPKHYRYIQHLKKLKNVVFLDLEQSEHESSWCFKSKPSKFLQNLLEYCNKHEIIHIGTNIFGNPHSYRELTSIIESISNKWKKPYPKEINIYYNNPELHVLFS